MKCTYALLLLLLTAISHAQFPQFGREPFVLKVQRNARQNFIQQIDQRSYFISDKILQLYPREKVWIEMVVKADTIYSMTAVPSVQFPEKTIEIEFCQEFENNAAQPAQYYGKNPFPFALGFNLLYYDIEESSWVTTAVNMRANCTSTIKWPKTISSLVFKDWRVTKPTADIKN